MDSLRIEITNEDADGIFSVSECTVRSLLGKYCIQEVSVCKTSTGLSVCGCVALVTAEGFVSANRSPSQKFFKHLDHCSEQLFFRLINTFVFVQ